MRFLHTADFHASAFLYGMSRDDELSRLLEELYVAALEEKVEFLLVAGDIFENPLPSHASQKLVFDFFTKISKAGIKTVMVSGNHDGQSLEPLKNILGLANIYVFGKPSSENFLNLPDKNGENVKFFGLPYPSERLIFKMLTAEDDNKGDYIQQVNNILRYADAQFNPNEMGIFVAHLFIDGSKLGKDKENANIYRESALSRKIYSIPGQLLPKNVAYTALGHIHVPQQIKSAPGKAYYSGSPYLSNFFEEGIQKGFYIVEMDLNQRLVEAKFCPFEKVTQLYNITLNKDNYAQLLDEYDKACYIKVTLEDGVKYYGLTNEIREKYPQVLKINVPELKEEEDETGALKIEEVAKTDMENILSIYQKFDPSVTEDILEKVKYYYKEVNGHAN